MRAVNTSLVINLVKSAGRLSRADLARESRLSPATISAIVGRLVRSGILSEVAIGRSRGGRPPVLLSLNERAAHVVGIKLKEGGLTTVVTDLNAEPIHSFESELSLIGDPQAALDAIVAAVERALKTVGIPRSKVLGIGVGLPGVVDTAQGVCRSSHILKWQQVPIQEPLRRRLRIPVWADNDVNTVAVADKWFGAGIGINHFLTVTVGRGIGLGIVIAGEIYRGAGGGAGELGHVVVVPDGPLCQCGRRGCLEAVAAEPAIRTQARRLLGEALEIEEIVERARGDEAVADLLGEAGTALGRVLANLVTLLNPERIIVSGEGVRLGAAYFDAMRRALRAEAFAGLGEQVDVVIEPWGDDAWAIGAATLVLRELFTLPLQGDQAAPLALLAGA